MNEMKRIIRPARGLAVAGVVGLMAWLGTLHGVGGEVTVRLAADEPVVLVRPGHSGPVELVVGNGTGRNVRGTLRFGVRSRSSEPVAMPVEKAIETGAGSEIRVPLPEGLIGELGIRYIDWELEANERSWSGVTSFAHMAPVGVTAGDERAGDAFIFGIAGGIRPHHDREFKDRFLEAAAAIGAVAYRMDMSWNVLQPEPDVWRWDGLDEAVDLAEAHGLFIQPLVAYGNPWAVSDETRRLAEERGESSLIWRYPPRKEPWETFNRELAERYGTRMQYYEIWNEPDISFFRGTAREYVDLLRTAYNAIKETDPEILVSTAGFTSLSHPELDRELQTLTFTEGRDSFDVVAWHRHGDFAGFRREVDDGLLPMLRERNLDGVPLVFNESAVAREFEREWELAEQLVKKMTFTWSRGAIGHYWYNLARSHPSFAMVNPDWTPRPSYPAYNELARQLRGRRFSGELDLGEGRWGFVFQGPGDFSGKSGEDWAIVSWTEDAGLGAENFALAVTPGARTYRVDLMGNRRPVSDTQGGTVPLAVGSEPAYLVIEGSSRPALKEFPER